MAASRPLKWSYHLQGLEAQFARCLVSHQHCDLVYQLLEMLCLGFLVAQDGQLVLNKRMPDNSQRGEFLNALDHSDPRIPGPAP